MTPCGVLADVFWLGGVSGAGKTTAARTIALRRDLRLYCVDHRGYEHARRATDDGLPRSRAWERMTYDERWLRDPKRLAEDFVAISHERLPLIVEDLRGLGPGPAIFVEGPQLLPELVAPLLPSPDYACWLLPSAELTRRGVAARGEPMPSSDEDQARANRLGRDVYLANVMRGQAVSLGLSVVTQVPEPPATLRGAQNGNERRRIRLAENAIALA